MPLENNSSNSHYEDAMSADQSVISEIDALWIQLNEVHPGAGDMPATLIDIAHISADAYHVTEASKNFDRLVSFHEKKVAFAEMAESIMRNPVVEKVGYSALVVGTLGVIYGVGEGYISPVGSASNLAELVSEHPAETAAIGAGLAGTVALTVGSLLDRGLAAYSNLTDSLKRLQDGASPNAERLADRLTPEERQIFGDVLKLSKQVMGDRDTVTAQRFSEQIHRTAKSLVDSLQGTPQAGSISSMLVALKTTLETTQNSLQVGKAHDSYDSLVQTNTPSSSPGL